MIRLPLSRAPRLLLALVLTGVAGLACAGAPREEPSLAPPPDLAVDVVDVAPELRKMAITLPPTVLLQLRSGRWSEAADGIAKLAAVEGEAGDRAFVLAYALVQAERGAEAAKLLPAVEKAQGAPRSYVDLIEGEILRTTGKPADALEKLERVPQGSFAWGRAQVARAAALVSMNRVEDARKVLDAAAARPDPAPDNERVLLALADLASGPGDAYAFLRRIWREYPGSKTEIAIAPRLLAYGDDPGRQPTWQDAARRAERRMAISDFNGAIADTDAYVEKIGAPGSLDWCRFKYVRGRSFVKKNQLANGVTTLAGIGAACQGDGKDYGAKGLYLLGTSELRRKQYANAASAMTLLGDRYAGHSMADDGYLHAGIALQEAGDLPGGQALWRKELDAYPDGDTVGEATWRLAWSLWLQGDTDGAIDVADALGRLPVRSDAVSVAAGRYWAARWRAYPTRQGTPTKDPARRKEAIEGFASLCADIPHGFYAIQAYSRLVELDPARAAQVAKRPPGHETGAESVGWTVRQAFHDDPAVQDGVALARVGLVADAKAAWAAAGIEADERTPDEVAWLYELRIAADEWLIAHDEWRGWIRTHAIESLGPHQARIVRLAYPDRYWKEVKAAVPEAYVIEPRYFHALTREESNFNASIVSHAGAVGLSQLMPPTAAETAGWIGLKIVPGDLNNPAINAKIGAKYLDVMVKQHGGSPYLALAAYNAGGGRTRDWRTSWGDVPTDVYVESIPFKETRDYVKRVMGTWQTYRYRFDTAESAFPDLSKYNTTSWPGFVAR